MRRQHRLWNRTWLQQLTVSLTILTASPRLSNATPEGDPLPLKAGQPAPFDGILLSHDDAAALWKKIELLEGKLALEEKRCTELRLIDGNKCFLQLSALRKARDEQVALWRKALEQCETEKQRAWFEDPSLLIGTGVVLGAALGVGVVWLGAQFRP